MLARAMAALPSGSNARVEDVLEDEFAQRVVEHLTAAHAVSGAAAIAARASVAIAPGAWGEGASETAGGMGGDRQKDI